MATYDAEEIGALFAERHEATRHLLRTLRPNPRLTGVAAELAQMTWEMSLMVTKRLGDGPELSAGLRKLREAKDCFVLQHIMCDDVKVLSEED